jgi:hypothetical protein
MDIRDILQVQTTWLDNARAALTRDKAATDPPVPLDVTQKRIDMMSQRVADLTEAKKAAGQKYDEAIADLSRQRTDLEAAASQAKALLQRATSATEPPTTVPGPEAPPKDAGTEPPPKQAIAALLASEDAVAATPAQKGSAKTPPKRAKTKARTGK